MSKDAPWIAAQVTEAMELHASVTEAVSARIKELLNGELKERNLPKKELLSIAEGLISEMAPAPLKVGAKQ